MIENVVRMIVRLVGVARFREVRMENIVRRGFLGVVY
jgi:hypothetical protein